MIKNLHLFHKKIKLFRTTFIFERFMRKLKLPLDSFELNKKILNFDFTKVDILFTIKGNEIKPWTLKFIKQKYPHLKIISWSLDDMYAWHNRSFYYTLGIKYYDIVFTTKSYNIHELKLIGAKRVEFIFQAYSVNLHKPYKCKNYIYNVIFIGDFEQDRFEKMLFLAQNGIEINIFGPNWNKYVKKQYYNLVIHNKPLIGEDYSKSISCSKITLCFLRKINRDLQTSRTMEIPACGGFMIAERTNEHLKLFNEDKEAVYFSSKKELLEKVKYYLKYEEKRKEIAKAGYRKTISSKYSYDDRVEEILGIINNES